jgi:hypothetical protein
VRDIAGVLPVSGNFTVVVDGGGAGAGLVADFSVGVIDDGEASGGAANKSVPGAADILVDSGYFSAVVKAIGAV